MRKSRLGLWNFKSELGTTLMEIMVSVGILGVTAVGMSQYFGNSIKAERQDKIRAAMEFLARDIENKLKSPSSIYLSLMDPVNSSLATCVLGIGQGCDFALTTPGSHNGFALNYATGLQSARRMTLSGRPYVYYDANNLPCSQGAVGCVFYAETFFYATCDSADVNYPQCLTGPVSIHVGYSVKKANGALTEFSENIFKDLPLTPRFYTHQLKDILGIFSNATCNFGSVVTGYDRRGFPICECKPPTYKAASTRYGPLCVGFTNPQLTCPNNQVYRGMNSDGTARCEDPNQAYKCIDASPVQGLNATCPAGYWVMQDVRPALARSVPYTPSFQSTYWERNGMFRPSGCNFFCTLPDIRGGSWDCGSSEAGDTRFGGGEQGIVMYNSWVVPYYNTINVSDMENPPGYAPNPEWYSKGLVCPVRRYKCCTPSGL